MHECDDGHFFRFCECCNKHPLRICIAIVAALTKKELRRVMETLTQDTLAAHKYSADRGSVKGISSVRTLLIRTARGWVNCQPAKVGQKYAGVDRTRETYARPYWLPLAEVEAHRNL